MFVSVLDGRKVEEREGLISPRKTKEEDRDLLSISALSDNVEDPRSGTEFIIFGDNKRFPICAAAAAATSGECKRLAATAAEDTETDEVDLPRPEWMRGGRGRCPLKNCCDEPSKCACGPDVA